MSELKLVRFYRISLPCFIFFLLFVINGCTAGKTALPNATQPSFSGRLLIDISDHNGTLYGSLLSMSDREIRKTYEGERKFLKGANETGPEGIQPAKYKEIFDAERWYNR